MTIPIVWDTAYILVQLLRGQFSIDLKYFVFRPKNMGSGVW